MRGIYIILSLVLCLSAARPVAAQDIASRHYYMGARDLMNFCRGSTDIDYGYCAGYIGAIADTMLAHSLFSYNACNHGPVQDQQLIEIVSDYIATYPQNISKPASMVVAEALARAFSCDR